MITPTKLPISVYRGSAYDQEFSFTNADDSAYDLTGWTVLAHMNSADPKNGLTFSVDVDEAGGSVVLSLTDAETSALDVVPATSYVITGVDGSGNGPYFLVIGDVTIVDVS